MLNNWRNKGRVKSKLEIEWTTVFPTGKLVLQTKGNWSKLQLSPCNLAPNGRRGTFSGNTLWLVAGKRLCLAFTGPAIGPADDSAPEHRATTSKQSGQIIRCYWIRKLDRRDTLNAFLPPPLSGNSQRQFTVVTGVLFSDIADATIFHILSANRASLMSFQSDYSWLSIVVLIYRAFLIFNNLHCNVRQIECIGNLNGLLMSFEDLPYPIKTITGLAKVMNTIHWIATQMMITNDCKDSKDRMVLIRFVETLTIQGKCFWVA